MDKAQKETRAAIAWLCDQFLQCDENSLEKIQEDSSSRPDFYYSKENLLLEVSTITDRTSVEQSAQWVHIINKLQNIIDASEQSKFVNSLYMIETPEKMKTPTDKDFFITSAQEIIKAVLRGSDEVTIAGNHSKITKIKSDQTGIFFTSQGGGGFFDPAVTLFNNISTKVRKANKQLGFTNEMVKPNKRILLLVNQYHLLTYDWDLYKGIGYLYEELLEFSNIDEIWLQNEMSDGTYKHKLLYDRTFFTAFEDSRIKSFTHRNVELFSNWFAVLSEKGDEKKSKLLFALHTFLDGKQADLVFKNNLNRIEIVRFGEWLVEQKKRKDLVWLIDRFITDSDPPDPQSTNNDEDLYYHNQILKNRDDVYAITGVLGHLAWVIQKMAVDKELVPQAFIYTKKLMEHKNLYVKLQAIIPLIEVARRRKLLSEYDQLNKTKLYKEFKNLIFDLVENYSQYVAISKWLVHIFNYYRDLNTKEAILVLEKLQNTPESAALFIIFGIFRKEYETKVPFNGELLERKLINVITSSDLSLLPLRSNIAWNFWRLIEDEPEQFRKVRKYIELFLSLPYERDIYSSLEQTIESQLEKDTEFSLSCFELYIRRLHKYLVTHKEKGTLVWITPEVPINKLAEEYPDKIIEIMSMLLDIWKAGAYIGNISELFQCFKKIIDTKKRVEVKQKLIKMYSQMKKLNPHLQEVNWD